MNWKLITAVCISITTVSIPVNLIGCADEADAYDYYTSFFSQALTESDQFKPFYYTNLRFLYGETEQVATKDQTSAEWQGYCKNKVPLKDIRSLLFKYPSKHLQTILQHLKNKKPLTIPDSIKNNHFTKWLIHNKDKQAVQYLVFAKESEPYVTGDENSWEDYNRDSVKMSQLIVKGIQLHQATTNPFVQLRYGYQIVRLAHYSGQYQSCIQFYEAFVQNNPTQGILQTLARSLKAGAMKHLGKNAEAAYVFSTLFANEVVQRRSNYMSFYFSNNTENGILKPEDVTSFCKSNREKANVLGLFALHGSEFRLNELKQIAQLDPGSSLLELLMIREVNKHEEKYLHPFLLKEQGEKSWYSRYWYTTDQGRPNYDSILQLEKQETMQLAHFCHQVSQNPEVKNRSLFEVAAAYCSYMCNELSEASIYLEKARNYPMNPQLKDQWALTRLLVNINKQESLDSNFEAQLLPEIQWLAAKATKDPEWKKFYRNLFTDILAVRYKKQKNPVLQLLCIGAGERIFYKRTAWEGAFTNKALNFLRTELNAAQVEQLIHLIEGNRQSNWQKFLLANNTFTKDDVYDIAGTSLMREHRYEQAIGRLQRVSPAYYRNETFAFYLKANPFADLRYDTHKPTKQDTRTYNKTEFARTMHMLQQKSETGTNEEKARATYQMANGLYQISYWGNSWMQLAYEWSSGDGYNTTYNPGNWKYEYYGVFKAEELYLKAAALSNNQNFRAKCIWMAAKCAQKQNIVPTYALFSDYDEFEDAWESYTQTIRSNKYFDRFKSQYQSTPFYKEMINSCVYLQDYLKSSK